MARSDMTTIEDTHKQVHNALTTHLHRSTTPSPLQTAALVTALHSTRIRDMALAVLLGHKHIANQLANGDRSIDLEWITQPINPTQAARALKLLETLASAATTPTYRDPISCLQAHILWCAQQPLAAHAQLATTQPSCSYATWLRTLIHQGIGPS